MQTYNLEHGRRSDNPIKRQIGDLIGKIGSPSFEPSFFQIVREATACEHVTAFASSDHAPARLLSLWPFKGRARVGNDHLGAGSRGHGCYRERATAWRSHPYRDDPANRVGEDEKLAAVAARLPQTL